MRLSRRLRRGLLALGIGTLLVPVGSACSISHPGPAHAPPGPAKVKRGGPPSWAPAHGHRYRHPAGVDLVFDVGLDVYVVAGHAGHFYHDGHFFRRLDDGWVWSVAWEGPWIRVQDARVPPGLLATAASHPGVHPRGRGRGRGPGPASHGR